MSDAFGMSIGNIVATIIAKKIGSSTFAFIIYGTITPILTKYLLKNIPEDEISDR
jgi:uncharacterized membrane protein YgaE (UPF0421/DUF939 family)